MANREPISFCPVCGSEVEQREVFGWIRPVCPSCGKIHFIDPKVGAGVLVSQSGRVLLVRRAVNPEKGKWTLPAGFVEGDEDPKAAAVRECLEETGLNVEITGLLDVLHGNEHRGGASIVIVYTGEILGGELEARDDADAVDFYDPNDLPPLGFEATDKAISRWQAISARRHSG
jgi:ADP-ribose pyrophosphatase YjhB (NUDIX family)